MWLSPVKQPMPLGPEAFSLCILTCETPGLRKYKNFKNYPEKKQKTKKLFWLDPYILWGLGKGDRLIQLLKLWLFGNLVANHPDDFLNFPCPFCFLEVDTVDFASESNLFFSFSYNTSNYVHGNLLVQLGAIIIHTFTVILYNVARDGLNLKLMDRVYF